MAFDGNAQRGGRLKHPFGLRQREADVLAKYVHRFKQPFAPESRHDLLANLRQISVRILTVLLRHGVGGEQRWADLNPMALRQSLDDAQHFLFGLRIQAIARLDLKGGDAFLHQAMQTLFRPLQ
ncbi:N-formimino-L-glutamate deiminase [compost metagenome]